MIIYHVLQNTRFLLCGVKIYQFFKENVIFHYQKKAFKNIFMYNTVWCQENY